MKEIKLTQGKIALVDDDDYDWLNKFKWCVIKSGKLFYASRLKRKSELNSSSLILMHRIIMNVNCDEHIDHIDGNSLNNQKLNLRVADQRTNCQNLHISKTSKYPGVHHHSKNNKWIAQIQKGNKRFHLGCFDTEKEAYKKYMEACNDC